MLTLHLDIVSEESAATSAALPTGTTGVSPVEIAFRGERPEGADGTPVPLVGDELLEAVREVVWFKDGAHGVRALPDGVRVIPSVQNLLMFLSDVRTRRFKAGVFLGDDVLAAAETFRAAARTVAAGAHTRHFYR